MKRYLITVLCVILLLVMTGCVYKDTESDFRASKDNKTTDRVISETENASENPDTAPKEKSSQSVDNNTSNTDAGAYLPEEDIKAAVLTHAGLSEEEIKYYTAHLDYDDDLRRYEYEVSFHAGQYEYDYEVDALSGDIIDFDKEHIYD